MFIDLNFDDLLHLFQLLMIEDKKFFHLNDNIIDFFSFKMFTNCFIVSHIWIEIYLRMKFLIEVKWNHWDD